MLRWTTRLALLAPLLTACTSKWSYVDQDGDGVSAADGDCWDSVDGPAGTGLSGDQIYPGAVETWYDGFDQDCAGDNDYDQDGDGFVPDAYSDQADGLPTGDCDDTAVQVNPGAVDEFYDGVDSDCSGNDDFDQDGDGYVSDSDAGQATQYVEGSGELPGGDCDDSDGGVNPAATDTWYDGVDTDCAGNDDYDQDGDGYVPLAYDGLPTTYVDGSGDLPAGDCDDTDPGRVPDDSVAVVWYNGYDERCDENDGDQDGDGYWDINYADKVAASGTGYDPLPIPDGKDGDCFDDSADRPDSTDTTNELVPINGGSLLDPESVYPGADDDSYDGVDADCAGDSDFDKDGDSYDSACVTQRDGTTGTDCIDSDDPADCGDDDPAALGALGVYPGAIDTWYDGTDANCDGYDDWDQDYDHYVPDGYSASYTGSFPAGDCDDLDDTVNPGETDSWYDGEDTDCSGNDDYDQDGDGYVPDAYSGLTTTYVSGSGGLPSNDCDDTDSGVNPSRTDSWYDGIDTNCSGNDDYDRDGDGYVPDSYAGLSTTYVSGSGRLPDNDCDDTDSGVNPSRTDSWYDGIDTNCSGNDDYDQDSDGYVPDAYSGLSTTYVSGSGGLPDNDCDDTDSGVNPSRTDSWYDGEDTNCSGNDDYDQDGDGYVPDAYSGLSTTYVSGSGGLPDNDCDDTDGGVNPGAADVWYDGEDTNCSGNDDYDQDGDGYVPDAYTGRSTTYVSGSGGLPGNDCVDTDSSINPGATEIWYDGTDQDCNTLSDYDADLDGQDSSDYGGTDCDDTNDAVYYGQTETCSTAYDDNCDGDSNDLNAIACVDFNYDGDSDGYGTTDSRCYCEASGAWSASNASDCDDTVDTTYPGAPDTWYDGVDSDCGFDDDYDADLDGGDSDAYGGDDCNDTDASIYWGAPDTWYDGVDSDCAGNSDYDRDGDGEDSDGYGGSDCNDGNSAVNTSATETCSTTDDDDCSGTANDQDAIGCTDFNYDYDGDGYGLATTRCYCEASGYWTASDSTDCDDLVSTTHPGASDTWYDGVDSDCGGDNDYDADVDGDESETYGTGGDCDDHDATVSSLLTETWYNGVDNDCAGGDDYDADADSYAKEGTTGSSYPATDCNDGDDTIHPGTTEIWYDGVDQDCSTGSDYDADGDGDDSDAYSGGDCDDADPTRSSLLTEALGALGNDDDCDEYIDEDFISQGDIILSEIMVDGVGSSEEEWFELYNTSSWTVYLDGWEMVDEMGSGTHGLFISPDAGLSIAPSDYVVLCSSNTYLSSSCDYVYGSNTYADSIYGVSANGSFKLNNSGGTISVFLGDGTSSTLGMVDDITVNAGTFPITEAYSAELGRGVMDDVSNDDAANWCEGSSIYSYGSPDQYGTPGFINDCNIGL